jgi:hypothetical protein
MQPSEDPAETSWDSFLRRFVHPRLAAVAIGGAGVWGVSFLVAGTGVALQSTGRFVLGAQLFFLSSLLGIVGILVLGCCTLWLVGLRIRQVVFSADG